GRRTRWIGIWSTCPVFASSARVAAREHRTLDEVERDNRKRNAALRKAAHEARNASTSGEPEAESADSDAHQASLAKDSEDGSAGASEADSRKSDLEDDSQVESSESSDRSQDSGSDQMEVEESDEESVVEVMVKTEHSAEDRGSDSPQYPDEAEIVEEKIDVQVERSLSTVQEETASEDMEVPPALTETPLPEVQLTHPTSESQTSRSPVTVDARDEDMTPAQVESVSQAGAQITEDQAEFYPDSQAYYLATLQTSRYPEQRMSVATQTGAWISELRVCRNTFGLALDLTGLMIPVERLSPVECVATIQTLLPESGFKFQNVIPVWSDARISKVHSELIQLVCDDLQRLLSVELLEWRQLISEATRIFLSDEELDVLMTVTDGQTPETLTAIHEVKDSMAQMKKTQETLMAVMSALALRGAGNMDVKDEQEPLLNAARYQAPGSQSPEVPHVEAGYLAQDALESRFAEYQGRAETHMEAQRRQHLDEMTAFEKEFKTLRLERDQEREANKNLQSFLVGRLKKQVECQGVCDNGLKPVPKMTTQAYVSSDSTTGKPVSSGVNMGVPPVLRKQMVPPEVKTLYAIQTQVALRYLNETKENVARAATAKAAPTTAVKTEATADVQKAPAEGKPRKRSVRKPDRGR
ncbi:hypothetical protein PHMEG_00022028, partial [Phytophthora megakarya]